jgi:AraC family transcriptional regulator, regulatory protein of adaptative response / methylated-DNA-[protein]-cysteine methyltransferase
MIFLSTFETPLGTMFCACSEQGLCLLEFAEDINQTSSRLVKECQSGENHFHHLVKEQLTEYFSGNRTTFDIPFDLSGSDFQQKVWELLLTVPYGSARSYLEQAKLYGDTKAIRAIAKANGENPIAIIIPCHRIIGSNGDLTGYAGGLWRKKWLLEHEQKFTSGEQRKLF